MTTEQETETLESLVAKHFGTDKPKAFIHSMGETWEKEALRRISEGKTDIFSKKWKLTVP